MTRPWVCAGSRPGPGQVAGEVCLRSGPRARLVYRRHLHHGRADEPKTFAARDNRGLSITVHRQLDAPLVGCRDNLSRRPAGEPADFAEANRRGCGC